MNLMKGLIAGLIAGIMGAVIWAAIAFYGKVEIGYLAWGIGALVGFAFAFGSKGGGAASAAMAVLITVLSICGGKYLGASWAVDAQMGEFMAEADQNWTDEYCISYLADDIIETKQANGEQVNLEEPEDESMDSEGEYPADIWAAAKSKWEAMDQTARKGFIDGKKAELSNMQGEFRKAFAWEAFKGSFGPIDIIFFVLGVVTAWQIAFMDPVKAGTE